MVCFIPLVKANLKCILGFIHIHIALNFQQAHVFLIYENKKKNYKLDKWIFYPNIAVHSRLVLLEL